MMSLSAQPFNSLQTLRGTSSHSTNSSILMPSQYGAKLWAEKETKRLARISAEIVKGVVGVTAPTPVRRNSSVNMEDIIPLDLQKGTMMLKVSEKKEKHLFFRIDPDEGAILYKTSKDITVPIESIKELRVGADASYYRHQFQLPEEYEERWITIIYILEGEYKTLHIVALTRDIFQKWATGLQKLHTVRQGLMAGLGNTEVRESVWERQYWKGADEEGDQLLDLDDIERLCRRLNANIPPKELRELFERMDTKKRGHLDFEQFRSFVAVLKRRPDIEGIYTKLASPGNGTFDLPVFIKFMKEYQKSELDDRQLAALFDKYTFAGPAATDQPNNVMSLHGFTKFLFSNENTAFIEQDLPIWQDMTSPISDYYISSSHNTYLVGHQLVGVSTIEGYIRALLHSCRSVELDIYDGDTEPMVYHGKTLTKKVPLRAICSAIAKYAFATSPYPLLISAEVHCGLAQQDKIVDVMTEIFGAAIVQAPVADRPRLDALPSPEALRGKFLLKAKNLYVVEQLAAAQAKRQAEKAAAAAAAESAALVITSTSETSSDGELEVKLKEGLKGLKSGFKKMRTKNKNDGSKASEKTKMSFRLAALLVYTVGVKCHGIDTGIVYAPEHIFSLSENSANRLLKASVGDLVKHNHTHLVRIYPKGTRVDSTNYEPHRYWAAGCQVVAINWQTFDLGYMINQAMFQRNGRAGYVLKPEALRFPEKNLLAKRTQHFLDVTIISAQQLPRLRDANGHEVIKDSVVDPYVQVSLHIPDWSHSPFLPAATSGATYSPPSDATVASTSSARTVSFSTPAAKNNGFSPVWQTELCLPFDCVGDMTELIFVEFAVRQDGKDLDDEPIGTYCVPLGCLNRGFRHLPLHDAQLNQHLFSTLFVQINIRDA